MKKKAKIIVIICAVCLLIGAVAGYMTYNYLNFGPIKAKEPLSIKTSSVEDTSDVFMIAHRGFSAIAPENTLEAFQEACDEGFFGCEFDIHLTSDGQWVVMHDANIRKMTGKKGVIEEMTLEELRKIPLTNGANIEKYDSVYIPTLEETLSLLSGYDTAPVIEIKTATTEKMDEILELLEKYDMLEKVWIISFEKEPLLKVRELSGDIKISYLVHEVTEEAIKFCLDNKLSGVDFNKKNAGEEQVKMILDAGLVPQVWTVDLIEDFERFYSYGVRYFTGNCLTY